MSNTSTATAGSKGATRQQNLRCHRGDIAIMSGHFGTRIVRVVGRAADLFNDWKVEIMGSPVWCIDARTDSPKLTNLGFVKDSNLYPLNVGAEVSHA